MHCTAHRGAPLRHQVTLAYELALLVGFCCLLVYVQGFSWALAIVLASCTVVVVGGCLGVAMVRGGMVTGLRAIFVSFLTVLQAHAHAHMHTRTHEHTHTCTHSHTHTRTHTPIHMYLPQTNLVLNAIVTFELPAGLTLVVNAGAYVALLLTLLLGLKKDDGAGRLYGSGVEVRYSTMAPRYYGSASLWAPLHYGSTLLRPHLTMAPPYYGPA